MPSSTCNNCSTAIVQGHQVVYGGRPQTWCGRCTRESSVVCTLCNVRTYIGHVADGICTTCNNTRLVFCPVCQTPSPYSAMRRVRAGVTSEQRDITETVCIPCYRTHTLPCSVCGTQHLTSVLRGGRCVLCRASFYPDTTFNYITSQRYVGVEFEHFLPIMDREALPTFPFGSFRTDGSLSPSHGGHGWEFITLPARGDALLQCLAIATKALSSAGGYVNRTCGAHVHLDMSNTTEEQRRNVVLWWQSLEDVLFALVDRTRDSNQYCRRHEAATSDNRYRAFNIQALPKHGTYEVRLHHGTLDFNVISSWVIFLLHFFDTFQDLEATSPALSTVRKAGHRGKLLFLFRNIKAPLMLMKTIVRRLQVFNGASILTLTKQPQPKRRTAVAR